MGALDQYSTAPPPLGRAAEQLGWTPAFVWHSHPMTSPLGGFAAGRPDSNAHAPRGTVPPLQPVQTLGALNYMDSAMTPIKVDMAGAVDKGPFLSCDQEWTCYRRNYLACVCSYTLSPPCYPGVPVQFTPPAAAAAAPLQVYGFAMCISAVVADNEQQHIELVQHTPKRDKGPTSKPAKIPMAPKTGAPSHHSLAPYGDGLYAEGLPAEHTFERIQFKNATLNNGKRRAAQQYYHLIVELWADVGAHAPDQYVKVAYRKSAKMIVRGRSPGHYQNERHGSQGNGPGGSAGSLSGYATAMGPVAELHGPSALLGTGTGAYAAPYDGRGGLYGGARHHELPDESIVTSDDAKAQTPKAYHYYPAPLYDSHHERVDLFGQRSGPVLDNKVKNELDFGMLPRPFNPGTPAPRAGDHRQHDHFDSKATSGGYYPSMVSTTGIYMTMA